MNKTIVVTAPQDNYSIESQLSKKLFLAGGITNCPDWQSYVIKELKDCYDLVIYNPRRKNFPINKPKESEKQITWEFRKLQESNYILFWFASGSINPIVLYELGMWGNSRLNKKIVIGIDPKYERKEDVIIQTKLARVDVDIVDNLEYFVYKIKNKLLSKESYL